MPRIDQKNALNLVSLVEIEYVSDTNVLHFQSVMHFSGPTSYVKDFIGDRRQNGRKPFSRMDWLVMICRFYRRN